MVHFGCPIFDVDMCMLIVWTMALSGHTCALGRAMGDHGTYAGKGRRKFHRDHGLVCAPCTGHGDARQRGERSKRVHGPIHTGVRKSMRPYFLFGHKLIHS
jgi:hypothetical protein